MAMCGDRTRKLLLQSYRGRCAYCGGKLSRGRITIDHVFPKSKGGKATDGNIRPACQFCNMYKSNLSEYEFKRRLLDGAQNDEKYASKIRSKYDISENKIKFYFEKLNNEQDNVDKLLKLVAVQQNGV